MLRSWIAALLVLLTATAVADSPTLERIAESGQFRIGYVPDSPPLSFENSQGQVVGYSIDLCRHIASAIRVKLGLENLDIRYRPLRSMQDRIAAIENGDVDLE